MKKIFLWIFAFLVFPNFTYAALYYNATFDETGTQPGWTTLSGTPNYDFPTGFKSAQSLNGTSDFIGVAPAAFQDTANYYNYSVMVNTSTFGADSSICPLYLSNNCRGCLTSAGLLRVFDGTSWNAGTVAAPLNDWFVYQIFWKDASAATDAYIINASNGLIMDKISLTCAAGASDYRLFVVNGFSLFDNVTRTDEGFKVTSTPPPASSVINNTKPYINISYPANFTAINNGSLYPIKINGTISVQNGTFANLTINSTSWKLNITLGDFLPKNLPYNRGYDSIYDVNMSGNVLLIDFDNPSNSTLDHSGLGNHGTAQNGANGTPQGKIGWGYEFDGVDDYVSASFSVLSNFFVSYVGWVYPIDHLGGGLFSSSASNYCYNFLIDNSGEPEIQVRNTSTSGSLFDKPLALNSFNHIAMIYNGTHGLLYLNGSLTSTFDLIDNAYFNCSATRNIGYDPWNSNRYFNGTIDEVAIFNRSLSADEIFNIYQTGIGNRTPSNANFSFTYNGSGSPNGLWVLNLTANSTAGNKSSEIIIFTIDLDSPTILSSTLTSNHTLFYVDSTTNFTYQINLTDNIKLYSINVTDRRGYSTIYNGINQTSFIYNGSVNVSTYGLGRQNLSVLVCDAHTSSLIDDYKKIVDAETKEIYFDFTEEDTRTLLEKLYKPAPKLEKVSILPSDPTLLSSSEAIKQEDRYIFRYSKTNKTNNKFSFVVDSTEPIDIIGDDKTYKAWLVIPGLKKWIDFNTNSNAIYKVTRSSETSVQVDVDGITDKTFEFHSIGDLNCISRDYSYYLFNYTAIYSPSVVETIHEYIRLIIDVRDILLNGNGTLYYNQIPYTTLNYSSINQINLTINFSIPQVPSNETNVSFYFDFKLNSTSLQTINFTQLVNRIRIALCSGAEIPTLNISIFNENSPTSYIKGDIDSVFTIWTNSSDNNLNFTFPLRGSTNYSLCLYPNTTINIDADMLYNTSGGFTERWFLRNARLTTNTSLLYLYNFISQTGISTLKGTLKDTSYENYPNVIAKLQRRYLAENVYRTVQMDKSDDFGLVLFNIIETSQDYIIIFEEDGTVIDSTNPLKFLCTSGLCDVTFVVTPSESSSTPDIQFQHSYNNNTQIYQLNFSDTTGLTNAVRLVVTRTIGATETTICDTTVTASSGTINCDTTGYDGSLRVQVFSSASPYTAKLVEYINKIKNKLYQEANSFVTSNELTLWATGISSTLIMAGSLINPVIGIIAYIVSIYIISLLGLINFLTVSLVSITMVLSLIIIYLLNMRRQ